MSGVTTVLNTPPSNSVQKFTLKKRILIFLFSRIISLMFMRTESLVVNSDHRVELLHVPVIDQRQRLDSTVTELHRNVT